MSKRFPCPNCRAELTVEGRSEQTVVCPGCGRRCTWRPKPAPAASAARARGPEEGGSLPAADESAPPKTRNPNPSPPAPAKGRKKSKKTASRTPAWIWAAAGGAGLVGVLAVGAVVVGLVLLSRGAGTPQKVEEDRKAREQSAPVNEFPPVAWTLKPGPGPKLDLPDVLKVHASWQIALVGQGPEYLSLEGNLAQAEVRFGRFDPATGRPAGPSTHLKGEHQGLKPSAVSPNGTLVLGVGSDRLFQIYDPNKETPRSVPGLSPITSGRTQEPTWFDFSADGRFWLVKDGTLVAWDLTAGKPAFTATGRYTTPAVMGPDRKWLAVQVDDKYLEVLDAATGECRGRFGGEGRWQGLAVTPDGRRLAGVRFVGTGFGPGAVAYDFPFEIHDWDLTTGERKAIVGMVRKLNEAKSVHWLDADHLLVEEALLDMGRKIYLAAVTVNNPHDTQRKAGGWTADGRQWEYVGGIINSQLVPVKVPLDEIAGEPAFRPPDAVKVEARCGDATLDGRVKAIMSDALGRLGFRVAEGGWVLRVSAEAKDTGKKMTLGAFGSVAVPEVKGTVELVAPDGTVTATSSHHGMFPGGPGSKYYVKSVSVGPGPMAPGEDVYDFGGRSPAEAMREGAWDRFIQTLPDSAWPRAAWKSGDQYVKLPLKIEVTPTAKGD